MHYILIGFKQLPLQLGIMKEVYKHSILTRVLHWLIATVLIFMIYSGLLIYWAHQPYQISIGSIVLVKFFPKWFFEFFSLNRKLAAGMQLHFSLMWMYSILVIAYFLYIILGKRAKEFVNSVTDWKMFFPYLIEEITFKKQKKSGTAEENLAKKKYNPVQKIAYLSCIIFLLGCVVSGFAIHKPFKLDWLVWMCGGYEAARFIHFFCTINLMFFIIVHITQVMRYGFFMFLSIITGYERKK